MLAEGPGRVWPEPTRELSCGEELLVCGELHPLLVSLVCEMLWVTGLVNEVDDTLVPHLLGLFGPVALFRVVAFFVLGTGSFSFLPVRPCFLAWLVGGTVVAAVFSKVDGELLPVMAPRAALAICRWSGTQFAMWRFIWLAVNLTESTQKSWQFQRNVKEYTQVQTGWEMYYLPSTHLVLG